MCSCRSPAIRWTARLHPSTSGPHAAPEDVMLPRPQAPQPQKRCRPRRLLPSGRPAKAETEHAWATVLAGVRPVRGVRDGDCGRDHGEGPAGARPRHRSRPQVDARRVPSLPLEPHARRAQCDCRCRRESVRETWVEEAPVDPAPVFRFAVCAASNGRASICACCTCNTLEGAAAMSGAVPAGQKPTLL